MVRLSRLKNIRGVSLNMLQSFLRFRRKMKHIKTRSLKEMGENEFVESLKLVREKREGRQEWVMERNLGRRN